MAGSERQLSTARTLGVLHSKVSDRQIRSLILGGGGLHGSLILHVPLYHVLDLVSYSVTPYYVWLVS